jgi:flagellar secretion chaperone FliS
LAYQRMTQEYQKSAVNGASPLQLIIMLYDGALKFMQSGKAAMAQGDRDGQNANLQKAQKVLMELMSCLDMKQGGEIAKNLLSLYSYVLNELVMANMEDDPEGIDRGIQVLTDLRESWREIQNSLRPAQEPRLAA